MLKFTKRNFGVPIQVSSGIEPTPALTYIRRTQKTSSEAKSKADEEAVALQSVLDTLNRIGMQQVDESSNLQKVHYLNQQIGWLKEERARLLNSTYELQNSNAEWRAMVEKLRAKLVEQDEVIKKLIAGNSSGKKVSIC